MVAARNWQHSEYFFRQIAQSCDAAVEKGWQVVFVPFHYPGDVAAVTGYILQQTAAAANQHIAIAHCAKNLLFSPAIDCVHTKFFCRLFWLIAQHSNLRVLYHFPQRLHNGKEHGVITGYPFTLLLFWLGASRRNWILTIPAIIGQVSLVNTYAHIHTALLISLHRSLNGLVLGLAMGLLLLIGVQVLLKLYEYVEKKTMANNTAHL